MNDVFRAHKKKIEIKKSMAAQELDLTPRAQRSGWSCFRCCFPGGDDENENNGTSETADESTHLVVEEEKEEITSRELDLPPEPDNDEYYDTVQETPKPESKANFVLAFWQFFMTVFFFSVWEGNDKKLTNGPSSSTSATTTTSSEKKKA